MTRQLALNVQLRDSSSFENYETGRNRELLDRLLGFARSTSETFQGMYLWGERGAGKTHLIEAVCRLAQHAGQEPVVLPLAERGALSPSLLDELEPAALICVDDMQSVAGQVEWETAVLGLYERQRTHGGRLLVTGEAAPARLGLQLPDLATRLAALLVYPVHPLSDAEKISALIRRAERRGLELPEEVARYLLQRTPRDMHSLFGWLDRLDAASLAAQRRLTIPFLRELERQLG
jgi:DnaA-homolog protein